MKRTSWHSCLFLSSLFWLSQQIGVQSLPEWMIFPLTPTNFGCRYHIFWIHKCITQITAESDTGALSPCVSSAALHAQGRAPGWEKARRRAPATRLPWLWRTSCSGRATANLSPLRYVSRWLHHSLTKQVSGSQRPFETCIAEWCSIPLSCLFQRPPDNISGILRSRMKATSWITFVVERTPQETGFRLVGGQVSFFFKSGFLIMDVFVPKSIAGLLKRWRFLWLTQSRAQHRWSRPCALSKYLINPPAHVALWV